MSTTDEDMEDTADEEEVQRGSLLTQSLPHNYAEQALEFEIEEFRLDGTERGDRGELDEDDQYLSLIEETWETLSIHGTIDLKLETIKEVFPPEEWEEPPGRLALVKTNPLAIHRSRNVLKDPPIEAGPESFKVEIKRSEHRGTVTVEPFLTRASQRDPGATNCASKAGSRLANGTRWSIQLDEPSDGGGLLMPIIDDFENNDRFPNQNHIHYLSLDEPKNPQLYLNRGHPQVVKVLENEGATGGPPRLRDILYDYIEHSVWTQLIVQTARDTDPDTGETKYNWQEDVLDLFLDHLYPDMEDEQAAIQLATDIRNGEDLPTLMQNIERAIHQQYDIPGDTTKLIEEAIQSDN